MSKFLPGQSGNPAGKKKGTVNKRTQLAKLLEPYAEELIAKAVELARSGDVNALRLCIERLIPKATSKNITIAMPHFNPRNSNPTSDIYQEILKMLSGQEVTLDEVKTVIDIFRKQISPEINDIASEAKLTELINQCKRDY